MGEDVQPSNRVVEQRLRNRVIDALETLAAGDDGARLVGAAEYVNQFFDWIDDGVPWEWRQWPTLTPGEVAALDTVQRALLDACAATAHSGDDFVASGWPQRIKPDAIKALNLMRARGRFHEDDEEDSPSVPG